MVMRHISTTPTGVMGIQEKPPLFGGFSQSKEVGLVQTSNHRRRRRRDSEHKIQLFYARRFIFFLWPYESF